MDPVSTASTAIKTVGIFTQVKRWWQDRWGGTIVITDPHNRDNRDVQPWIKVKGTHTRPKGKFWLLTHNGDQYWPQKRIILEHDGIWNSNVHANTKKETRNCAIVLAKVGDFADAVFEDYKTRGGRTKDWSPLKLPRNSQEFNIIQEIVILVLGTDHGGKEIS
jgi:hypothetical protein